MTRPSDPIAELAEGILGHRHVLELLVQDLAAPAQAYLFVGPANVGKATVARRFAAAMLAAGDPEAYRRAVAGNHPDLVIIEPEGRASITVAQARSAVALASLSPLEAGRRVFLLEEAGMMNDEAANALLKTLEEPAASTAFVLVAESEDELPDTIASRCRTVVFGRVSDDDIVAGLVASGVDADQAARAARIAGGRPGLALALATRPEVEAFRAAWLSVPLRVSEHPGDAFRLATEVVAAATPLLEAMEARQAAAEANVDDAALRSLKERHDREQRRAVRSLYMTGLEILVGFYRDVAAAQFGAPVRNPDIAPAALASVSPADALAAADRVLATVETLEANQRPELALAALFTSLGAGGGG